MSVQDQPSTDNARKRILEETWKLLEQSPDLTVRIADIAAAAGVSRQAVYLHFGSRSNLLLAAVRYRDATTSLTEAFVHAARHDPLPGALAGFVAAWFDYIPRIQPVANLLSSAAQIDPDARAAWEDRMSNLRNLILVLTGRLATAGHLDAGWTAERAADWIWHHTHVDAWRHLVGECGWVPSDVVRQLVKSLERDLLA